MAQPATNPKIEELRFRLKTDAKSRLFYPLAEELRKAGQLEEAESVLRTGLEHHPTYLSAWVSLGRVLRDQKNDDAAIEPLSKALQLDPGNVVAARLLADSYLALGNPLEALKKYKLVHALMPGDEELEGIIARVDREVNPPQVAAAEPEPVAEETAGESAGVPLSIEGPLSDEVPLSTEAPWATEGSWSAEVPQSTEAAPIGQEESPWADAASSLIEEQKVEEATGDVEPMSVAHEESPFEEPSSSFTAATFEVEAPPGMHVGRGPLDAEVPLDMTAEIPMVEASPIAPQSDVADVFEPSDEEPAQEDITSTLTMADLYARQGLISDARQIYETILHRDPNNDVVRAKLAALDVPQAAAGRDPKVMKLEAWLARVGRREVSRV
jgi:tetratricopeptide (TPR) repeat protein